MALAAVVTGTQPLPCMQSGPATPAFLCWGMLQSERCTRRRCTPEWSTAAESATLRAQRRSLSPASKRQGRSSCWAHVSSPEQALQGQWVGSPWLPLQFMFIVHWLPLQKQGTLAMLVRRRVTGAEEMGRERRAATGTAAATARAVVGTARRRRRGVDARRRHKGRRRVAVTRTENRGVGALEEAFGALLRRARGSVSRSEHPL